MVQFIIQTDGEVRRIRRLPVDVTFAEPFAWTVQPSLSSPDLVTGTTATVDPGTNNKGAAQQYQWLRAGDVIEGETGLTYITTPADNDLPLAVRVTVSGYSNVIFTTNALTFEDPEVEDEPDPFAANLLEVSEIRDPEDPDFGTDGGRRRFIVGNVTVPTGFTLRRYMNTTPRGGASGQAAEPNTTYLLTTEYPVDTVLYADLALQRTSDSVLFSSLPPSGTTAGAAEDADERPFPRDLTPIVGNTSRGHLIVTIVGPEGGGGDPVPEFENVGTTGLNEAIATSNYTWTLNGGAGENSSQYGLTHVCLAFAAMRQQTSAYTKCLSQARAMIANSTMPAGHGFPAAIRQSQAITFFDILRHHSPHMWVGGPGEVANALTAAEGTKMDRIVEGLAICAGVTSSGNRPKTAAGHPQGAGEDLQMRGWGQNVEGAPNFELGDPLTVINAACYMGPSELDAFFNSVTMSSFRSSMTSAGIGTSANLYRTLNWRNEGVASGSGLYRSQASTYAPTDTQIHTALRNYRYRSVPLTDFGGMLYFTRKANREGWFSAFPYQNDTGSFAETIGRVMSGIGATAGSGWIGTPTPGQAGRIFSGDASIPYLGQRGMMIYEWAGRDDGGQRWHPGYANWTYRGVICCLLSMELAGAIPHGNALWDDEMLNMRKFREVREYMMAQGVWGWSHGNGGGPGGTGPYSEADWKDAANEAVIDAFINRVIPV